MSIDWSATIEAVHEDGQVEAVTVDEVDPRSKEYYTEPDLPYLPQVWLESGAPWVSSLGSGGKLSGWRIRNVALEPLS